MKHYIIVKFTDGTDFHTLENPVRGIFEETLSIPGIHGVDIRLSNSDDDHYGYGKRCSACI